MPTEIDSLQIEINAKATKANEAIDRLVGKLNILSTSLSKINGSNLTGLANGVQKLGTAMQTMNTVKTSDFTRLAKNLTKLTEINVAGLNGMASSLSHVTRAFNNLGTVTDNAQKAGELANSLAKFGYKSVTTATANIPQLATALSQLMTTLSKAPRVSKSVINMTNALANLASQGRSAGTASKSLANSLKRVNTAVSRTSKGTKSLAAAFGKFYATYFLVIRGIKGLWKSIKGTADYIEAFNYYTVAFGKVANEWSQDWEKYGYENAEAYAESFTKRMNETLGKLSGVQLDTETGLLSDTGLKNLGLNIQEITQYASQLASVTNSLGQTGETTLAISQSFTKLAGDISSLFNVDYSTVANNLQSGLIGQSRALYKYGIDITNATLQTYAYNLGLEKSVSEMTQMEKQQLRVLAILDQSKVSWGDLANTINSPSNMIRQLTNNLKEVGIVLGQLFIPLLQKVLPVINGVTIAIKRLLTNIAGLMGIELDLSAFGQGYDDSLEDMTEDMEGLTDSAKKASGALGKFDEINNISTGSTADTSGLGSTIDLTQEIIKATEEYESVWNTAFENMENKAQEWADKISNKLAPVKNIFTNLFSGDFGAAGADVSNLVMGIVNFFTRAIQETDWESIGSKIIEFLANVNWAGILLSVGNFIGSMFDTAFELWKGAFDAEPLATTIVTALALAKFTGLSTTLADKIKSAFPANVSVGKTILIAGITWEIGFNLGNWIAEKAFGAETEMSMSEQIGYLIDSVFKGDFVTGVKMTWEDIKTAFANGWDSVKTWWKNTAIYNWWNDDVKPWFTREKWVNLLTGIKLAFYSIWGAVKIWWENTALVSWWNNNVKPWFTKEKWVSVMGGIKEGLVESWNAAIEGVKSLWNTFANWLNEKLTWTIPPIDVMGTRIFDGVTIDLGVIPTFSTGGFPEDGLFMANHNELVGQFSNGRTAVANNQQITAGIEEAAYRGMARALAENAGNSNVTFSVEGDTNGLFKVVRKEANAYFDRTGKPAFNS